MQYEQKKVKIQALYACFQGARSQFHLFVSILVCIMRHFSHIFFFFL